MIVAGCPNSISAWINCFSKKMVFLLKYTIFYFQGKKVHFTAELGQTCAVSHQKGVVKHCKPGKKRLSSGTNVLVKLFWSATYFNSVTISSIVIRNKTPDRSMKTSPVANQKFA